MERGFTVRPATEADLPAAQAVMLRTLEEDFRTGYDPAVQLDIADLRGTYLEPARHVLFVAVDEATGEIVATGGTRDGRLAGGPPHLVERYARGDTAQLVRIYVRREDRRRGIARAVVLANLAFILAEPSYVRVALHTFPHSPGALPFWESMATRLEGHERDGMPLQLFFEIDLADARRLVEAGSAG